MHDPCIVLYVQCKYRVASAGQQTRRARLSGRSTGEGAVLRLVIWHEGLGAFSRYSSFLSNAFGMLAIRAVDVCTKGSEYYYVMSWTLILWQLQRRDIDGDDSALFWLGAQERMEGATVRGR